MSDNSNKLDHKRASNYGVWDHVRLPLYPYRSQIVLKLNHTVSSDYISSAEKQQRTRYHLRFDRQVCRTKMLYLSVKIQFSR